MAGYRKDYSLNSLSAKSIECVVNEFKDLDEVSAKSLCTDVLMAVKEAISYDKIDCLKNLSLVLTQIVNEDCFNNYQRSDRIGNFNLVLLACKSKAIKNLEYIFSEQFQTLYKLSIKISGFHTNKLLLIANDEFSHNAFYYAIQSNMIDLLNILVEKWRSQYNDEELDDILSQNYKELKLRNVSLTKEMTLFVQSKILDFRFFHAAYTGNHESGKSLFQIKKRIKLVVRYIQSIKNDYWYQDPDEKFMFIAEFIAKSFYTLKSALKSTYNILPWEEIEFCLIIFIRCCKNFSEPNLVYNSVLNKKQLLMHLFNFSVALGAQNDIFENSDIEQLSKRLTLSRDVAIKTIIENNSEFRELYEDYEKIRNFCSLEIIKKYTDIMKSYDTKGKHRNLLISRVLQVMGEHLKNTLYSPKLSTITANALLSLLPVNTREMLTKLRDSLSHTESLFIRSEMEKKAYIFKNIERDISKIKTLIPHTLHRITIASVKKLMEKVSLIESTEDIREFYGPYRHSIDRYSNEIEEANLSIKSIKDDFEGLEELLVSLDMAMKDKDISEKILFGRILYLIQKEKERFGNIKQVFRQNAVHYFNLYVISKDCRSNNLRIMAKSIADLPSEVPSVETGQIGKLFIELLKKIFIKQSLTECGKVNNIIVKIWVILYFEMGCTKWIEEFASIINQKLKKKKQLPKSNPNLNENLLSSKLSQLKEALGDFDLEDGTSIVDFSSFESNKELQAVTEMLVLDILCILKKTCCHNEFFLDSDYPLLTGKNLRNHLAHGNILVDICLEESSGQLLINAKKLLTSVLPSNKKQIDKVINCDSIKLERSIDCDFQIIINQRKLFIALEEGDMKDTEESVNRGAHVFGKDWISSTCLHFAAKAPDITALKWSLKQGLSINSKNIAGETLLHIAAKFNRTEVIRYFVEQEHMSLVVSDENGKTPLHVAVENQSNQVVEYISKFESSTTRKDKNVSTPLHTAIYRHNIDAAKILLEKEKNVDEHKSISNYTALHIATISGNSILVNLLLAKNAGIDSKSDFGETPLHAATDTKHIEIVKTLVENGADVNAKNEAGITPLHNATLVGSMEIVEFLLEHGAEINVSDYQQMTPVMMSAKKGHVSATELLLRNGAFVNSENNLGFTPLHFAAMWGHYETVELLLNHKAIIDSKNNANSTALHLSVARGHKEVTKLLLNKGADINATESMNITPLHIAVARGNHDILDILMHNGADVNCTDEAGASPLLLAILRAERIMVESLLKQGADFKTSDINRTILLYLLLSEGFIDILTLDRQDVNSSDISGYTLLHLAAFFGNQMLVEYCTENDCDINVRNNLGSTALHLAAASNYSKIVSFLLSKGARIDAIDDKGFTPLLLAVQQNRKETVEILVSSGINDFIRNDRIQALETSVFGGYSDIVDILLQSCKFDVTHELKRKLLLSATNCNHKLVMDILLENGFEINGDTKPLHVATYSSHYDMVEFLLTKGANPNVLDQDNCTPLDIAVKIEDIFMLEILLSENTNVRIERKFILSATESAIKANKLDIIELLLQMKVIDVNARNDSGYTLLHISALSGILDITRHLVVEGADVNATDKNNRTPVQIAAEQGFKDVVEFYLNCSDLQVESTALLLTAASNNKANICELLIQRNAEMDSFHFDYETLVTLTLRNGHKEAFSVLLNYGAYYNASPLQFSSLQLTKDNDAASLLIKFEKMFDAVKNNSISEVENLLSSEVNEETSLKYCFANGKCVRNETVLHYASWKGYKEIIDILLKYNTNPNARTKTGCTPLHYAAKFSHFSIVKALLSKGATYNAPSQAGKTPLDYATDPVIRDLLLFLINIFTKVQKNDFTILENLRWTDESMIQSARRVKNQEGKTLIEMAYNCGFTKTKELQELFETDLESDIKSADKTFQEEKYSEALLEFKNILRKRVGIFGEDSQPVLDVKMKLAEIYRKLNEPEEALNLLLEVHERRKSSLGEFHWKTLIDKTCMAFFLAKQGETQEALRIFKAAYIKLKEKLKPDDLRMIEFEMVFTSALFEMKKFDEVLKINYEVEQKCALKKDNQYRIMLTYFQFSTADILFKREKFPEALILYKKVYKTRKDILTVHHARTLQTLRGIAATLDRLGKYDESLEMFRKALYIQKFCLPVDHIEILANEFYIGCVLYNQGQHLRALKIFLSLEPKFAVAKDSDFIKGNKERIEIIKNELAALGYNCVFERIQSDIRETGRHFEN